MSESAPDVAPEPDTTGSSVEDSPLGDGTAVDAGSAREAEAKMVEASRFNGLMSAHQRTLTELDLTKTQVAALEARLQEKPKVADETNETLSEVQLLRQELKRERLETKKRELLEQYPEAKPFADFFIGGSPDELESVIAAVANRVASIQGESITPSDDLTGTGVAEGGDPVIEPVTTATAPVVGGGASAPSGNEDSAQRVQDAIAAGDWGQYWAAKSPADANNLA